MLVLYTQIQRSFSRILSAHFSTLSTLHRNLLNLLPLLSTLILLHSISHPLNLLPRNLPHPPHCPLPILLNILLRHPHSPPKSIHLLSSQSRLHIPSLPPPQTSRT